MAPDEIVLARSGPVGGGYQRRGDVAHVDPVERPGDGDRHAALEHGQQDPAHAGRLGVDGAEHPGRVEDHRVETPVDDAAQLVFPGGLRPVVGRETRIRGPGPVLPDRPPDRTDVVGVQRAAVHQPTYPGGQRRFGHVADAVDIHPANGAVGITGNGDLGRQMDDELRFGEGAFE